jgi:hypothetical protein
MLIGIALDATAEVAYWTATRTIAGVCGAAAYMTKWAFVASRPRPEVPRQRPPPEAAAARCVRAAALLHRRGALSDEELVAAVRSVVQTPPPTEDECSVKAAADYEPPLPSVPPAYELVSAPLAPAAS